VTGPVGDGLLGFAHARFAVDSFAVSDDDQALTQIGDQVGQPPTHTIVHERESQR